MDRGSNGPLWSLAYEAFYYALFPLVLVGVLRTRGRARIVYAFISAMVVAGVSIQIWILFPIWLTGALLAHQEQRIRKLTLGWAHARISVARMAVVGLLGVSLLADRVQAAGADSASLGSYAVGLSTAALVALLLGDLHPKRWITRASLGFPSGYARSSFSLYAIHMPLLLLTVAVVNPVRRRSDLWFPSAAA